MQNDAFENGKALVGGREVPFTLVTIQKKFRMYIPESFEEEANVGYRYSYFSNKGKSPLGIALKYTPVAARDAREKLIANYLGDPAEYELTSSVDGSFISYREAEHAGERLSVYSLRFAVDAGDGVLFGCFNTSANYRDDWKDAVLKMLESIEVISL